SLSGLRVPSKIVPAVTEVWARHFGQRSRPRFMRQASPARALWADESLRPPQALQVAQAGGLIGEEPIKVRQVRRVVNARSKASWIGRGHTTIYCGRLSEDIDTPLPALITP